MLNGRLTDEAKIHDALLRSAPSAPSCSRDNIAKSSNGWATVPRTTKQLGLFLCISQHFVRSGG